MLELVIETLVWPLYLVAIFKTHAQKTFCIEVIYIF